MKLGRGTVALLHLDPAFGHEQGGVRPCVVVSNPDVLAEQRFKLICVVPVTGTPGQGLLYPALSTGASGLTKTSFALVDQVRAVDKRRVRHIFGQLPAQEVEAIDRGLAAFLGLRYGNSPAGPFPVQ